MDANDNAGRLNARGARAFFASRLLAMGVNDNAGRLNARGARTFFASGLAPTDLRKSL